MLVAVLWGANIGSIYPLVEVSLQQGRSLHHWVDERIATFREAATEAAARSAELAALPPAASAEEAEDRAQQIEHWESVARGAQRKSDSFVWLAGHVKTLLPDSAFQTLVCIVIFVVVGTSLRCLFLMINIILVSRIGQRTVLDLQNRIFNRTLDMELAAFGTRGTGDLINRIRGETGLIGNAINTLLGKTIREPMKMAACLTGAALVNWRLLLLSVAICPIAAFVMLRVARLTKNANRKAIEQSARLLNRLFQALTYIKAVKAYTMERHERRRFRAVANDVYRKGMRIAWYTSLARTNNEMLGVLFVSCSLLAGGYLVLNEQTHLWGVRLASAQMSFGEIMVFFAFLIGVSDPLRKMADTFHDIQTGIVAAERVFPLLDEQPKIASPAHPSTLPGGLLEVAVRGVSFAYRPETPVLNDVSFRVRPGSCLAIVGPNGCGKSTLVDLMLRFYDPAAGEILLGGVDVRSLNLRSLRRSIGYVTQQTMLFDDTIANNIRYGIPGASDEAVVQAARRAHADYFIRENLADGYESMVGEHGGKLSGGQRQRLALARAILKDPRLLILDEATSQIDPESETLIHETLAEFIKGRTTIIVTHRMSTLDLADQILVMDAGKVVDYGTHHELIARCPLYQRLRQSTTAQAA